MSTARTSDAISPCAKRRRPLGIAIAIIMVALGVLLLVLPRTLLWLEFLACAGLIVYGVYQVIRFISTASGSRQGWDLALGIINIIVGIFLITAWKNSRVETALVFNSVLAFMLGILSLVSGISECSMYGGLKKAGSSGATWMLVSGILDILLAIFFVIYPFTMVFMFEVIIAIYLLVGGVALFARSCTD